MFCDRAGCFAACAGCGADVSLDDGVTRLRRLGGCCLASCAPLEDAPVALLLRAKQTAENRHGPLLKMWVAREVSTLFSRFIRYVCRAEQTAENSLALPVPHARLATDMGSIAERQLLAETGLNLPFPEHLAPFSYTPASRYNPAGSFPLFCPAREAAGSSRRVTRPPLPCPSAWRKWA